MTDSELRDFTHALTRYEGGEMGGDEVLAFFQHLVDTGIIWSMEDSYVRDACAFIEAGFVCDGRRARRTQAAGSSA